MKLVVGLVLAFSLVGCSSIGLSSLLGSKGVNTAANVQAGANNAQTVGQTNISTQRIVRPQARTIEQSAGETKVRSERVETVYVQEKDSPWLIIALALATALWVGTFVWGWLSPSPRERRLERELHAIKNPPMEPRL
jgi:hypothetical protein